MLREAGFSKRSGVATVGIKLISKLAKKHNVRDWPNTRTVEDYDTLINLLALHFAGYDHAKESNAK